MARVLDRCWHDGCMKIRLTQFRVREGKAQRTDEWMQFLNDHLDALRETLEPEQVCFETRRRSTARITCTGTASMESNEVSP